LNKKHVLPCQRSLFHFLFINTSKEPKKPKNMRLIIFTIMLAAAIGVELRALHIIGGGFDGEMMGIPEP